MLTMHTHKHPLCCGVGKIESLENTMLVRQSTWKFWPNLKLNDKVFFSFDYSSIGSQRTIPGGWHVATLEQFEIFKMAARYVKKYIIVLNCIQIWYIWHQ